MTGKTIFVSVTIGALAGMVLGGLFGLGAGIITPALFQRIIPWQEVEPIGAATFFGATVSKVTRWERELSRPRRSARTKMAALHFRKYSSLDANWGGRTLIIIRMGS